MDIESGLSATKIGFELLKGIRELLKRDQVDAHEISNRLMELQELLLTSRDALNDARDQKLKLEARIAELSRMADFGKDFKSAHGVYFYEAHPYCPVCWDVDRKPVRMSGPVTNATVALGDNWTRPFHKLPITLPWNVRSQMKNSEPASE